MRTSLRPSKITSIDRRSEHRYPFACDVEPLPLIRPLDEPTDARTVQATVVNVSAGGACILAEEGCVEPFSVLPCKFQFPGVPVRVPVLAQVRWIERGAAGAERLRIGLAFLA